MRCLRNKIILSLCFLMLFSIKAWAAVSRDSLTPNDFLEYTLSDLDGKLKAAVAHNNELSIKNHTLRKRVLDLRQRNRDLENRKIFLLEKSLEMSEEAKFGGQQINLLKKKEKNLLFERNSTQEEIKIFDNTVKAAPVEEKNMEQKKTALQQQVEKLKNLYAQGNPRQVRDKYRAEKQTLRREITALQNQISLRENDVQRLQQNKGSGSAKTEDKIQRQKVLKKLHDIAIENLQAQKSHEEELLKKQKEYLAVKEQAKEESQSSVMQLRVYRQELQAAISGLEEIQEVIADQYASQRREQGEFNALLKRDENVLRDKKDILNLTQMMQEEIDAASKEKARLEEVLIEVSDEADALKRENEQADLRMTQAKERLQSAEKRQASLRREQKSTEQELTRMKRETARLKSTAVKDKCKEFQSRINAMTKAIDVLQREIAGTKDVKVRYEREIKEREGRKEELLVMKEQVISEIDDLESSLGPLQTKKMRFAKDPLIAQRKLEGNLRTLRARKSMLSNSLETIRSKYNADQVEVTEFQRDEAQMREYLFLLNNEHQKLKEKETLLRATFDQLNAESGSMKKVSEEEEWQRNF